MFKYGRKGASSQRQADTLGRQEMIHKTPSFIMSVGGKGFMQSMSGVNAAVIYRRWGNSLKVLTFRFEKADEVISRWGGIGS